jgi:P3 major capsid protein
MPAQQAPMTQAQRQASLSAANLANRALVLQQSVNMLQPFTTQTVFPANQPSLTLVPNFVGLIKRFYLVFNGTIANTGSTTINLTQWGLMNLLSNVIYTDPQNNQRHNTLGLHLGLLSSAKRNRPFGTALNVNTPFTTGGANNLPSMNNSPAASWPVFVAPQSISTGTSGTFRAVFELPLAYSDTDLRGAVYSNLVNATQNIQVTFNPQAVTANPADDTYAVYSGAAGSAGNISSITCTAYQEYLYQLPTAQDGTPILPGIDLSTVYQLKNTNNIGITANQNFNYSYANFNSFVSTIALFNSTGTNAGNLVGTDVNYWQLTAANLTAIWKKEPLLVAQDSRERLLFDMPKGGYYFDSRLAPILTNQFGNVQLTLNPLAGGAAATLQVLVEYFASLNTAGSGQSLSSS